MLYPFLGLVAGILAGMAGASLWVALAVGVAACAAWFIIRQLSKNPLKAYRINWTHHIWIFMAFASAGLLVADFNRPDRIDNLSGIVAVNAGVTAVKNTTRGDVAEMKVLSLVDSAGRVLPTPNLKILVRSDILDCDVDDVVTVTAPLSEIGDNGNLFDQSYAKYLNNKGFNHEIRCTQEAVKVTGHKRTLSGTANEVRGGLERFIEHTRLAKSTQNFLITILLGDRAYLDDNRRTLFADAGISHILALSGMHVAIIAGIVMWLLFPINFAGLYRWRLTISAFFLLLYAFLTGLAPSIVRATLMTLAVLVSLLLERKNTAWNSLLLATFIILIFSPYALMDIGLQLSFLCVASLIFFVRPFNPIDHKLHPRYYSVCSFFLTSMVATLATWCVTAWYFGKIPLMFLPANMLVLPLLPVFITLAIIYFALTAVGLEPTWIGWILDNSLAGLHSTLGWLTSDGSASIEFSPSLMSVMLWLMLLVVAACLLYGRRNRFVKYSFAAVALLFAGTILADASRTEEDGFIMQQTYRDVRILSRSGNEERSISIPRRSISKCRLADRDILILDQDVDLGEWGDSLPKCDYLLIASGCTDNLETIASRIQAETIVLHPSMRKKREARLLHEADSLGLRCHSIRLHGPLKHPQK